MKFSVRPVSEATGCLAYYNRKSIKVHLNGELRGVWEPKVWCYVICIKRGIKKNRGKNLPVLVYIRLAKEFRSCFSMLRTMFPEQRSTCYPLPVRPDFQVAFANIVSSLPTVTKKKVLGKGHCITRLN